MADPCIATQSPETGKAASSLVSTPVITILPPPSDSNSVSGPDTDGTNVGSNEGDQENEGDDERDDEGGNKEGDDAENSDDSSSVDHRSESEARSQVHAPTSPSQGTSEVSASAPNDTQQDDAPNMEAPADLIGEERIDEEPSESTKSDASDKDGDYDSDEEVEGDEDSSNDGGSDLSMVKTHDMRRAIQAWIVETGHSTIYHMSDIEQSE